MLAVPRLNAEKRRIQRDHLARPVGRGADHGTSDDFADGSCVERRRPLIGGERIQAFDIAVG
ncbi:hypothetical protein ACU4GD_32615 [Cupriavidus basilensis]